MERLEDEVGVLLYERRKVNSDGRGKQRRPGIRLWASDINPP